MNTYELVSITLTLVEMKVRIDDIRLALDKAQAEGKTEEELETILVEMSDKAFEELDKELG